MKPLDPRLLRYSAAARGYLTLTVTLGLAATGLILLQAGLLAHVLASAATGTTAVMLAGPLGLGLVCDPAGARRTSMAPPAVRNTANSVSRSQAWGGRQVPRSASEGTIAGWAGVTSRRLTGQQLGGVVGDEGL